MKNREKLAGVAKPRSKPDLGNRFHALGQSLDRALHAQGVEENRGGQPHLLAEQLEEMRARKAGAPRNLCKVDGFAEPLAQQVYRAPQAEITQYRALGSRPVARARPLPGLIESSLGEGTEPVFERAVAAAMDMQEAARFPTQGG